MRILSTLGVGVFAVIAYSFWKPGPSCQYQIQVPDPSKVLCFKEASLAMLRDESSEQEYFAHLLAHLQGTRHPADNLENTTGRMRALGSDAFANSMRDLALKSSYQTPQGTHSSTYAGSITLLMLNRYQRLPKVIGKLFSRKYR